MHLKSWLKNTQLNITSKISWLHRFFYLVTKLSSGQKTCTIKTMCSSLPPVLPNPLSHSLIKPHFNTTVHNYSTHCKRQTDRPAGPDTILNSQSSSAEARQVLIVPVFPFPQSITAPKQCVWLGSPIRTQISSVGRVEHGQCGEWKQKWLSIQCEVTSSQHWNVGLYREGYFWGPTGVSC